MKTSNVNEEAEVVKSSTPVNEQIDIDPIRPELAEVIDRHSVGLDERRPEAVARRQQKQQRTARANVEDLCDTDRFIEYGALTIAAQRQRRSVDDLIRNNVRLTVVGDLELLPSDASYNRTLDVVKTVEECADLAPLHKNSYNYFMWENLFKHVNISPHN